MNNMLMSILVAGTALGGSALNNVESHTTVKSGSALPAGYFVQKATNSYTYVSTATHRQGTCDPIADDACAYIVPAANSIPDTGPYTKSQMEEFGLSPTNGGNRLFLEQE